jgi:hypothetical protein
MVGPSTAEQEAIQEEVVHWVVGLKALHARIAPPFHPCGTAATSLGLPEGTAGASGAQERLAAG